MVSFYLHNAFSFAFYLNFSSPTTQNANHSSMRIPDCNDVSQSGDVDCTECETSLQSGMRIDEWFAFWVVGLEKLR